MIENKPTLAVRVNDEHRAISVAVMAGHKILAEITIKEVLAVVAQIEQMERYHGSTQRENSED